MSPTVAWSVAQGVEGPALAVAGPWCFWAGKWKLAGLRGYDRPGHGYWLLGDGNVG